LFRVLCGVDAIAVLMRLVIVTHGMSQVRLLVHNIAAMTTCEEMCVADARQLHIVMDVLLWITICSSRVLRIN